jgi:hypothetical protein
MKRESFPATSGYTSYIAFDLTFNSSVCVFFYLDLLLCMILGIIPRPSICGNHGVLHVGRLAWLHCCVSS